MIRKTTLQGPTMSATKKTIRSTGPLERYLSKCPSKSDRYDFDAPSLAYEFGQKIREVAIAEEGVVRADQLKKFFIDISYATVRIKLITDEQGCSKF